MHKHLLAFWLSLTVALLFSWSASAVTIDWVTVGDPENPADTEVMNDDTTGYGSVAYIYLISKYEITNAQYADFLNAVAATDTYDLYNLYMANSSPTVPPTVQGGFGGITRSGSPGSYTYSAIAGREDMPVNYVSFWDAVRFANWLHNGQPTGSPPRANRNSSQRFRAPREALAQSARTRILRAAGRISAQMVVVTWKV